MPGIDTRLPERTAFLAEDLYAQLGNHGLLNEKVIVFCVDEEHAARMRQALVNENADMVAENQRYVMRITGSDKEGQDQLGNFIDPESKYPVLVTTWGLFLFTRHRLAALASRVFGRLPRA